MSCINRIMLLKHAFEIRDMLFEQHVSSK